MCIRDRASTDISNKSNTHNELTPDLWYYLLSSTFLRTLQHNTGNLSLRCQKGFTKATIKYGFIFLLFSKTWNETHVFILRLVFRPSSLYYNVIYRLHTLICARSVFCIHSFFKRTKNSRPQYVYTVNICNVIFIITLHVLTINSIK